MRNQDWSLVFFTTLAQSSVGIILWFTFAGFYYNEPSLFIEAGLSFRNPVLLALILIVAATVVSFLHLGNPSNAPKALNNLSSSWLSREILALGVYSLSLVVVLMLGWNSGNAGYLKYLLLPSSVFGLALLLMMIRIYVIPTIPAWDSWHTPLSFVLTAICLGLLTFLVLHFASDANIDELSVSMLLHILVLILLTETAAGFYHQSRLRQLDTGIDELVFDRGVFYRVFLLRMALLTIAVLTIFFLVLKVSLMTGSNFYFWLYSLSALVVMQELLGRLLFYSTYFRIGV